MQNYQNFNENNTSFKKIYIVDKINIQNRLKFLKYKFQLSET
jgi:hypothetical protein